MRIAVVELINKDLPGLEFNDDVPLGKLYTVDLDTAKEAISYSRSFSRKPIRFKGVQEYPTGKILPLDAFKILVE